MTVGSAQGCACFGGGGGAYAAGTYNITAGVTKLTITVGAGGTSSTSGTASKVFDANTHSGQLVHLVANGGQTVTSGNSVPVTGASASVNLGNGSPSHATGGSATAPSGRNLQPNSALSVDGGPSGTAYVLLTSDGFVFATGGQGGSAYGSGAGGVAGSVIAAPNVTPFIYTAQGGTPLGAGQGAGGGAVSSSAGNTGATKTLNAISGANGMVVLHY